VIRRAALLLLFLPVGGCGLHPLYAGGTSGAVASALSTVEVGPIDERAGWLVRNAVLDRLGAQGRPQYRLKIELDDSISSFGIRGDSAATRERRTLRARYRLVAIDTGQTLLDATAGADAGIDVVSSPYATIAAEESATERLAAVLADQIVARLGLFMASGVKPDPANR
jgi:LPS-assembly lipoprotein